MEDTANFAVGLAFLLVGDSRQQACRLLALADGRQDGSQSQGGSGIGSNRVAAAGETFRPDRFTSSPCDVGSLRQRPPALLGSNGGDHVKSVEDKASEASAGRLPEQCG
jgi:hypothetical protein